MRTALRQHLGRFEDEIAGLLMVGITVVLMLQVITRYVLNDPLAWTEEVSRHMFVWMVFFGASGAIRDRTHIAVDLVSAKLPPRTRLAVKLGSNILVLFFLFNLLYWGTRSVGRMWGLSTATLQIPVGLVYTVFPVTATLMIVRTLIQMRQDVVAKGRVALSLLAQTGLQ